MRCRSRQRAPAEAQIAAALASVPGSKLFVYEIPREPDDAVRVHLYSPEGTGLIVYVHPETLAVLKSVPHTRRLTEIVRMIHAELLAGRTGAILIELAASWAIIMLGTGLYLWWPRDVRGIAGVLYPRMRAGRRVFWRDLHAVTGIWVSAFAMFLLITALPWTTVWGAGLSKTRALLTPEKQEWALAPADEHVAAPRGSRRGGRRHAGDARRHRQARGAARSRPPGAHLSTERAHPFWRVRAETQNRPRVRELELDARSGEVLRDKGFGEKADDRPRDRRRHRRARGPAVRHRQSAARPVHRARPDHDVHLGRGDVVAAPARGFARRARAARRGIHDPRAARSHSSFARATCFRVLGASLLILWGSTRAGAFARP